MKRGRSTGKPTKAEADRIVQSKEGPCIACMVRAVSGLMSPEDVVVGCDYNHAKSGNIRRGHIDGYALCIYHHRRHPIHGGREKYGPSLMDGSRLFHDTYGSDDELIEMQTTMNNQGYL